MTLAGSEDPKPGIEAECAESHHCHSLKSKLDSCSSRVEGGSGAEGETCVEEFFDLMECVNHCVSVMIKSIGGSQTVAVIKINTQSFLIEILCILSYKECITTIFSDYQDIFIVTSFAAIYRTVAAHWADLESSVNDSDLRDAFSSYQSLVNARVVLDFETEKSKGYGFISLASEEEAQKVLQEMNKTKIKDREIRINWAVQKVTRSNTYSKIYNATPEYNCTVYVSNYADSFLHRLSGVFGEFGYVIDIKVCGGFSFVTMDSHHAASLSILQLNGSFRDGLRLKVSWGKPSYNWNSHLLMPYPYVYHNFIPFANPVMLPVANMNDQNKYQVYQENQENQ